MQVLGILQAAKDRVRTLLRRRMAELHAVASALINQETLDHAQISAICQKAAEESTPEASPGVFHVEDVADASPLPA
jgi:ATP-dependent Zn protease